MTLTFSIDERKRGGLQVPRLRGQEVGIAILAENQYEDMDSTGL